MKQCTRLERLSEEFARIEKKHGRAPDAELIVAEARDPGSPLHKEFEWDDAYAAHQRRLQVARKLLRMSVKVRMNARGVEVEVPERIHVVRSVGATMLGQYPKATMVLRKAPMRQEAVQTLARRLYAMKDELSLYEEAHTSGLIEAIERFYHSAVVADGAIKEAV